MDKIIEGIHHFQNDIFPEKRALFQKLAQGQHPETLMIACSDSRVSLELITQTSPGELFVSRNAGNIVPSHGHTDASSASVEYALTALPIRDVIVCGHSDCGAMKGLLNPQALNEMPKVRDWLAHGHGALRALDRDGGIPHTPEALNELGKLNVRLQLEHLHTYPEVFARVREGSLRLHGWFYQIDDGEVHVWDAADGGWMPLREAFSLKPAKRRAAGAQEVRHA